MHNRCIYVYAKMGHIGLSGRKKREYTHLSTLSFTPSRWKSSTESRWTMASQLVMDFHWEKPVEIPRWFPRVSPDFHFTLRAPWISNLGLQVGCHCLRRRRWLGRHRCDARFVLCMDSISWDISGNIAKLDSEIWAEVITIVQPKPKHLCSFFPDFFPNCTWRIIVETNRKEYLAPFRQSIW